jgi:hypothetical protein
VSGPAARRGAARLTPPRATPAIAIPSGRGAIYGRASLLTLDEEPLRRLLSRPGDLCAPFEDMVLALHRLSLSSSRSAVLSSGNLSNRATSSRTVATRSSRSEAAPLTEDLAGFALRADGEPRRRTGGHQQDRRRDRAACLHPPGAAEPCRWHSLALPFVNRTPLARNRTTMSR